MSFTFDLSKAVDRQVPPTVPVEIGAEADAPKQPSRASRMFGSFTPPWEGIPLFMNDLLTGGTRDESYALAESIRSAEKVSRACFYLAGLVVVTYLLAVGHFFKYSINFGRDPYALFTLLLWWLCLVMLLFAQLNGRLRALPATLTPDEVRTKPEYHLPALFFNYQAFGFERTEGYVAAFIVLFVLVLANAGWAVLLYDTAGRLLAHDPFSTGFSMMWISFLVQHVLTACALSVSYSDYRAASSKAGSPLTVLEKLRVDMVNAYIFVVIVLLLPVASVFVVYGLN